MQLHKKKKDKENRIVDNFEKLMTCVMVVVGEGFMLGIVESAQK